VSIVPKPYSADSDARALKDAITQRESLERGNRPVQFKKLSMAGDIAYNTVSFSHFDPHGYGPAVATRDSEGFVSIFGMIKWILAPVYPTTICILPVGFRPYDYDADQAPPVAGGATTDGSGGYASPTGVNNNAPPVPDYLVFPCISQAGIADVRASNQSNALYIYRSAVGTMINGSWISLSGIRYYAGIQG
jgi:hypothetical protein